MRDFKKLLIPAVILVILVGVYLLITYLPEKEDGDTDTTSKTERIQIFDFKKDDLTEILIEREDGVMQFRYVTIQVEQEKTDEEGNTVTEMVDRNVWQAVQPEGMNVNSSSIDTIAWNANTLKAEKLIEENPSNLAQYGLDKPVKLTFTMKDGTKHILHVGSKTPTGGAYYAKTANDTTVYTIGDYEAERFLRSKLELLVTDLYEKDDYTTKDFATLKFSRKGSLVFDAYAKEETVWWLTYPIDTEARYTNIVTICDSLAKLSVLKYVEEDVEDLSKYGLAEPAYILEYKLDGRDYKLSMGSREQNSGDYYAILNDVNLVFTLPKNSFPYLDKPIEEIVSAFVYLVNINDVAEMRITMDGRTDISRINVDPDDDENSTYEFNGEVFHESRDEDEEYISLFKKYYQGAIGLTVDKVVLDEEPELENPEVTIEYTLHTGEKVVVVLVPTPDGVSFYAFRNGKYTGMTLRQKQLTDEHNNGLRVSYPKLAEAIKERKK
jgi:hypothetical protein